MKRRSWPPFSKSLLVIAVQPVIGLGEGYAVIVPPLTSMLAMITSPKATPAGAAMFSVPEPFMLFVVAVPRWRMKLSTMTGLEPIAVSVPPLRLVLVVKV